MKLIEKNIYSVHESKTDEGVTYSYMVHMKSGRACDSRKFINYDENGRTTADEYKKEWLPKAVQNFIDHHTAEEPREICDGFTCTIYR